MRTGIATSLAVCAALTFTTANTTASWAQQPVHYGPSVTLDMAKKAVDAAEAEAKKNGWSMAIVAVSIGGYLIHASTMDQTQFASIGIAQHKARAAAMFRRPTKVFEDRVASGGAGIAALSLDGVIASEGGIPIMKDGKVIGALGCSGGTGAQDGQACKAGVDVIK